MSLGIKRDYFAFLGRINRGRLNVDIVKAMFDLAGTSKVVSLVGGRRIVKRPVIGLGIVMH